MVEETFDQPFRRDQETRFRFVSVLVDGRIQSGRKRVMHKYWNWFFCVMLIGGLLESTTLAADVASTPDVPDASSETRAYCGLYCVYAALNAHGKSIDFPTLLKTKYLGEMSGSTTHELSQAITDNGLQALAMSGLSRANLVAAQSPIILHVSTADSPGSYNYWILFLGMEGGRAKIIDAPHHAELIPLADVLARWDGVGLYVSDQLPSATKLKLQAICTVENLALAACLLVLVAVIQRLARSHSLVPRPTWQVAGGILMISIGLAAAWHICAEDGYARNPVAIRTVVQQHRPSFLPKLTVTEMESSLKDPEVVVIDARYPHDFESGHLPGAINIPVFSTQLERRRLLSTVSRKARVIVYCQSENCQFDEKLGAALYAEGIENVSLYPGGFHQWEKSGRPVKASDESVAAPLEDSQAPSSATPGSDTP